MGLVDRTWDSTCNSVAWRPEGRPVAIDFDLEGMYPLHEISIKNKNFTGNCGQREWRIVVLVSEDGEEFSEVGEFAFSNGELGAGEHVWSLPVYMSGQYVRVLVLGEGGLVTLREVEILGVWIRGLARERSIMQRMTITHRVLPIAYGFPLEHSMGVLLGP
jgi:hypothetical protein